MAAIRGFFEDAGFSEVETPALQVSPGKDIIQVQRLKKRKLVLRDKIGFIEDQLTPDISA